MLDPWIARAERPRRVRGLMGIVLTFLAVAGTALVLPCSLDLRVRL